MRDYVHVADIADAHVAAAAALADELTARTANIGRGEATSVLEVVAAVQRVRGRPVSAPVVAAGARATRPGWSPTRPDRGRWAGARAAVWIRWSCERIRSSERPIRSHER